MIAVLGRLLAAPARLDRRTEAVHLGAGVVVVVLALDVVTGELEQARDRVAVGAVAADATVSGPVGLAETISTCMRSRHAGRAGAETPSCSEHVVERRGEPRVA